MVMILWRYVNEEKCNSAFLIFIIFFSLILGATQKSVRNVSPIRQVELESVIEAPSRNEIARVEPQDVTLATATQPQDVTLATATRALPFFTL